MIRLKNVSKVYQIDNEITFYALKKVNLEIKKSEFVSIVGPSGSGKSTLMHIIGLLDRPTSGQVFINEKEVSKLSDNEISDIRNQTVGFIFQQFNLINKLTALENILIPTIYCRRKLNFDVKARALDLIKKFNIAGKENSYPNKLSGGQQQRVAIARALIMDPPVILADEPTGNLDSKNGEIILDLLKKLNKEEKRTVIIVTHDLDIAKKTDRIIKIKDGQIIGYE
ncbi:MAG: ABC transporter ATP-binding protein [Microgenomates group bacterium]|nr:ABC transporter ATP-binding protein [Microgenomates group bacterium]